MGQANAIFIIFLFAFNPFNGEVRDGFFIALFFNEASQNLLQDDAEREDSQN